MQSANKRVCKGCGSEFTGLAKVKGLCQTCAFNAQKCKNSDKPKPIKKPVSQKTKQAMDSFYTFAKTVWDNAKQPDGFVYCEETGAQLGDDFNPKQHGMCISHILSKGAYPELYYDPENINILHPNQHLIWEFGDKAKMRIFDPEKLERLKQKAIQARRK